MDTGVLHSLCSSCTQPTPQAVTEVIQVDADSHLTPEELCKLRDPGLWGAADKPAPPASSLPGCLCGGGDCDGSRSCLGCLRTETSLNLPDADASFCLSKTACCENVLEQSCQYPLLKKCRNTRAAESYLPIVYFYIRLSNRTRRLSCQKFF